MTEVYPKRIWLLPGDESSYGGLVWCEYPNPGVPVDDDEATLYVRADEHDRRVTELLEAANREVERRRDAEAKLRNLAAAVGGVFVNEARRYRSAAHACRHFASACPDASEERTLWLIAATDADEAAAALSRYDCGMSTMMRLIEAGRLDGKVR